MAVQALKRPLLWPRYDVFVSESEPLHVLPTTELEISACDENAPTDSQDMSFSSNKAQANTADIEDLPALNKIIISNVTETVFNAADRTLRHMTTLLTSVGRVKQGQSRQRNWQASLGRETSSQASQSWTASLAQSFKVPFPIPELDSRNPHHCIVFAHIQRGGQEC